MPSVFAGNQTHNGGFRADQLEVNFGGGSVRGLLVQNINFSFQQQVTMLYEVGSEFVYYVGGRAQGTAQIGVIVGPSQFSQGLVEKFRDLCSPQDIGFSASAGCVRGGVKYTLQSAILTGLAVTVQAQEVLINKNLNFMYVDLEYQGGAGPSTTPQGLAGGTVPDKLPPPVFGGGTGGLGDGADFVELGGFGGGTGPIV